LDLKKIALPLDNEPPPCQNGGVKRLTRERIIAALERLDALLGQRGCHAQLYLVGGAVLCLVHKARTATKDVDAWFSEPQVVRAAARQVAEEL